MTEIEGSEEIVAERENQVKPGVDGDVEHEQLPVDSQVEVRQTTVNLKFLIFKYNSLNLKKTTLMIR